MKWFEVAINFYKELYSEKHVYSTKWESLFDGLPRLSQKEQCTLDSAISYDECYDALRTMSIGKASGNDGIALEVWRQIFSTIGNYYIQMLSVAKSQGKFQPKS